MTKTAPKHGADANTNESRQRTANRVASFGLALLIAMWLNLSHPTRAYSNDIRLRKRILELEAENLALRKIIANIRGTLESVPKATVSRTAAARGLRVIVMPGKWGESQLEDIRRVCVSSAGTIWSNVPDDGLLPILVQRSQGGPISLFRRSAGNEYIVKLATGDRAWAQCAFQFSHEFCHILCNYRDVPNQQLWFEETLCECASLFALRRMAVEWKTNAPYSNWKSYSPSLRSYADDRIKKHAARKDPTSDFYNSHKKKLEQNPTDRNLNGYMAVRLLPLFEENPSAWQSLRYINLGPREENLSFKSYLSTWQNRVPKVHKPFVDKIADEFGIDLERD